MIDKFLEPEVLAALIGAAAVIVTMYWRSRRTIAQASETIASAADGLLKTYINDNASLREKVAKLELKLEDCMTQHKEAKDQIEQLMRRIECLEKKYADNS